MPRPSAGPFGAALLILLAAAADARAQDHADVQVTEADYATYRALELAKALAKARTFYDRAGASAHEAAAARAVKDAGWTEERYAHVESALVEARDLVALAQQPSSAEIANRALSKLNATTLATARAHLEELRHGVDAPRKADEQVRRELLEKRAGRAPDAAELEGRWEFDLDATVRALAGAMGDDAKAKVRETLKAIEGSSWQFGPGPTLVASAPGPDGQPRVNRGAYRLVGRRLHFKEESSGVERSLDVGIQGERLQIGMGLAVSLFRKR